jgi:nitrogen fixation-related uncharacterized protein
MDEGTAAVVVSLIAGFFGFLGIWWTNRHAKYKNRSKDPEELYNRATVDALMEGMEDPVAPRQRDYLAGIMHHLKAMSQDNEQAFSEVDEHLGELKSMLNDHIKEQREDAREIRRDLSEWRRQGKN